MNHENRRHTEQEPTIPGVCESRTLGPLAESDSHGCFSGRSTFETASRQQHLAAVQLRVDAVFNLKHTI